MTDERNEQQPQDAPFSAAPEENNKPDYGQYTYRYTREQPPAGGCDGNSTVPPEYKWNFEEYEATGNSHQKPKKNKGLTVLAGVLLLLLAVPLLGLSGYGLYSLLAAEHSIGETAIPEVVDAPAVGPTLNIVEHPTDDAVGNLEEQAEGGLSTIEIAKRVRPSVVGITKYDAANTFSPSGGGSGVIINSGGYIVTNAHVVENAIGINVELNSGETYAAQLVGIDTTSDLAVIRIEANNLVAAEFGDSTQLEVGERAIAIGNPGGATLAGSLSQGVISGINRTLRESGNTTTYIQTDAAINPGNSGGALVNRFGQVIGINSAKIAAVEYEGIGFSIPISEAKPILDDLMQYGYVKGRSKIGFSGQEINEVLSQINNLPRGIYIVSIDPTSDLAGRNVTKGDILTEIDGTKIKTFSDISAILKTHRPGDTVTLGIYRPAIGGKTVGQNFSVKVRLMEDTAGTVPR